MAFKYANRKESEKLLQKAEAVARKWLDKGYAPSQVAKGIWNHYGYSTTVKNGKVGIVGRDRCALIA